MYTVGRPCVERRSVGVAGNIQISAVVVGADAEKLRRVIHAGSIHCHCLREHHAEDPEQHDQYDYDRIQMICFCSLHKYSPVLKFSLNASGYVECNFSIA